MEIAALCDCDETVLHTRAAAFEQLSGRKVRTETEQRRLLDDPSIDAVSLRHARPLARACRRSGPARRARTCTWRSPARTISSRAASWCEAARKYQRIVQHGTQLRSSPKIREGIAKLKEGVIGDVYMGRAISFKFRGPLGRHQPGPGSGGFELGRLARPRPRADRTAGSVTGGGAGSGTSAPETWPISSFTRWA